MLEKIVFEEREPRWLPAAIDQLQMYEFILAGWSAEEICAENNIVIEPPTGISRGELILRNGAPTMLLPEPNGLSRDLLIYKMLGHYFLRRSGSRAWHITADFQEWRYREAICWEFAVRMFAENIRINKGGKKFPRKKTSH